MRNFCRGKNIFRFIEEKSVILQKNEIMEIYDSQQQKNTSLAQIESHLLMRHYDGLLSSGRIHGRGMAAY